VSAGSAEAGRTRFDIAAIVRSHRASLEAEHRLTREQKRVLTDIAQCRTAALGGHVDSCHACGFTHPSYNSCRNRHCPKCQALAQEVWIEKRGEQLLDVGHFHVVFTLPAELRPLAKYAPRVVFDALFHAAARTLLELGTSRLDAELGATLVLHTWTRDLRLHPHVHAIVTAGGLAPDRQSFRHAKRGYHETTMSPQVSFEHPAKPRGRGALVVPQRLDGSRPSRAHARGVALCTIDAVTPCRRALPRRPRRAAGRPAR
jgi:hypothetical protein